MSAPTDKVLVELERDEVQAILDWQNVFDGEGFEQNPQGESAARKLRAALQAEPTETNGEDGDGDDLCAACDHERFHHDDGREMGVETNCKARGCACRRFVAPETTKGDGDWPDRYFARFKKHRGQPWAVAGTDEVVAGTLAFLRGQDDVEIARYRPWTDLPEGES